MLGEAFVWKFLNHKTKRNYTMRKLLLVVLCLIVTASAAYAQSGKRAEFYIGYSNIQAEGVPDRDDPTDVFDDDFFDRRRGLHGVNLQAAGFFNSVFGLKGDFSVNRGEDTAAIVGGTSSADTRVFYFMGGPTLKFRNAGRIEPFVHALAGGAHTRFEIQRSFDIPGGTSQSSVTTSSTDFAAAIGGGLDVRVGERFSIRLIQVDYAPVFLRDRTINILGNAGAIVPFTLEGQRQDNLRFSIGIVF
jgi:opacity protein-like surface antigen